MLFNILSVNTSRRIKNQWKSLLQSRAILSRIEIWYGRVFHFD